MKRKADSEVPPQPSKRHQPPSSIRSAFHNNLFDASTLTSYRTAYQTSIPYPHAVVDSLIQPTLLRAVQAEIKQHIHFTLKETDIYRIHQSGDLANLSNLDSDSLRHLPNLVTLRDALYSPDFRQWVSSVTGAGNLSGEKTDMAVNVYTPGSYLLCHDDVIGSRRVSYILYLTDPDHPWRKEWGGGLRLYPTETRRNEREEEVKVPMAEHTVNIPPSFGQLSFFAVRPGESYHDVEEVYHAKEGEEGDDVDGGRVRMAISGWYHIPQEGEGGFEEGVEQVLAQNSSLAQLKGSANEFDEPQAVFRPFDKAEGEDDERDEDTLTEQELTFLLEYISPSFLTPDMIEKTSSSFLEDSFLQLEKFFREPLAQELRQYLTQSEANDNSQWLIARPPHKHRYAYLQGHASPSSPPSVSSTNDNSPISRILTSLLPSHTFQKWLGLITGLKPSALQQQNVLARRFRRGKDYALASPYTGEQPQLEYTIGITPSTGWDKDETTDTNGEINGTTGTTNGHAPTSTQPDLQLSTLDGAEFGGEEIYMAGDDDDSASTKSQTLPQVGKKTDPAVYKSATDDDDGILFTNTPTWNVFSVVLRDKGTLRFVKYVSEAARGDRWDIKGEIELADHAFEDEEERDSDEQRSDEDSDPNHYFEDYERGRAMEEHSTSEESEDGEEDVDGDELLGQ